MANPKHFKVERGGVRLDHFLVEYYPEHSRAYLQKLIEQGRVHVDGVAEKARYLLKVGQSVSVADRNLDERLPQAETVELSIVYEDADLLVLNKPAGMTVHPVNEEGRGTLVHALLAHNPQIRQAVHDPNLMLSLLRPGIVHRLDKDTSGLIVVAKNLPTLQALSAQFKAHQVEKQYTALLAGVLDESITINVGIERKESRMGTSLEGRAAHTVITPIRQFSKATEVHCKITTGRTHQIRVHAKFAGHPVLGDPVYYTKASQLLSKQLKLKRQLLHASRLGFTHPTTGKRLHFEAALPADMQTILEMLR